MTDDQLLLIWRTLHPVVVALDWGLYFCSLSILVMLFLRFRLTFLLLFVLGGLIELVQAVPNQFYPQGDARPPVVGSSIECLRFAGYVIQAIGVFNFVQWFIRKRSPQPATPPYSEPAARTPQG